MGEKTWTVWRYWWVRLGGAVGGVCGDEDEEYGVVSLYDGVVRDWNWIWGWVGLFDDYEFMIVMRWLKGSVFYDEFLCVIAGHSYVTLALYDTICFCTKQNGEKWAACVSLTCHSQSFNVSSASKETRWKCSARLSCWRCDVSLPLLFMDLCIQ